MVETTTSQSSVLHEDRPNWWEFEMKFRKWLESSGIESVLSGMVEKYPGVKLTAYESKEKIELMEIVVPENMRGRGIGTEIIRTIQNYASMVGKPVVLRPEADRGHKGDLYRFYRKLGFVPNKGRNMDYSLSSPTSRTMYWRPLSEDYQGAHRPPDRSYGAPLHDLTILYPPDVYENITQYMSDLSQKNAAMKVLSYRDKPEQLVDVYRAVPKGIGMINPGDWVALTKEYAKLHAAHPNDPSEDLDVISGRVKAKDLYNDGNSMEEWGYQGFKPVVASKVN